MSARLGDYSYVLPRELIAQRPLERRQDSRMMVLHRAGQKIEHRQFGELKTFLQPGDLVVLNDTRVLAARRFSDDDAVEFLFLERVGPTRWKCMVSPGRKMRIGATATIDDVRLRVEKITADGERIVAFDQDVDVYAGGSMPLPPYVNRPSDETDAARYQTVFAREAGAVAAPTAGLHFTSEILSEIPHTFVTLHVGAGTFLPVSAENTENHKMHAEWASLSADAAERLNRLRDGGRRIAAVGTTSLRTLESAADESGRLQKFAGETDIFITPGYRFKTADILLTNFHLPRSTLFMLVSAFCGLDVMKRAYAHAIAERYRFYSYGDACLLFRPR